MKFRMFSSCYLVAFEQSRALFYRNGKKVLIRAPFLKSQALLDFLVLKLKIGQSLEQLCSHSELAEIKVHLPMLLQDFLRNGLIFNAENKQIPFTEDSIDYTAAKIDLAVFVDESLQLGELAQGALKNSKGVGLLTIRTIEATEFDENFQLALVLASSYRMQKVHRLANALRSKNKSWLLASFDSNGGAVGPYFSKDLPSPCYNCLALRKSANTFDFDTSVLIEKYFSNEAMPPKIAPQIALCVLSFAAIEIEKMVSADSAITSLQGFTEIDALNFKTGLHRLLPVPGCSVCASPEHFVKLQSTYKIATNNSKDANDSYVSI